MTSNLVCPVGHADRLDRSLALLLPELSRGGARRLIAAGSVFVDGRRCQVASRIVRSGARLRVEHIEAPADVAPLTILYLDADLVAVDKPAGMASEPTHQTAAGTALTLVRHQLPGEGGPRGPLFSVHRLDLPTSGVLVFARTQLAAAALAAQWRTGSIDKRYRCRVSPAPSEDAGHIEAALTFEGGKARVDPDGKDAISDWHVLERRDGEALLEVRPRTGRTHQIRAHLAHANMPILGDRKYGGIPDERLWLHATAIEFLHPSSGTTLLIQAIPPHELRAAAD